MAVMIKCKMCGGDLNIVEGAVIAECEYCGSRQTIPNQDSEKKLTLFARADRLRRACEFDKAAGVYESIVAEFPEEAEAYWGLVLCRYGIEYVDDPATGKKVPTCHRSSFDSILEDADFDQASENADPIARRQYREEAKAIEGIRKGILEVSSKEEPYDIFICYKETDENGGRTIDSVIAQDVYDALAEKGYRVFFSRISLEDKLGTEYEPYIFAALNSAKVMLAFGTDFEYFNAVWVKNEWSRFLALMAAGQKKTLIPCYKNLDAYDMPKEFQRLQAQDMGKVGAIQDLLRGIEKLLPRQEKPEAGQNPRKEEFSTSFKRGNLALEDREWEDAFECFDDALDYADSDDEYFSAYLGRLCANLGMESVEKFQSGYPELCRNKGRRTFKCSAEVKAGYQALGTKQWALADEFFDSTIELDPECSAAYIGKLMASYKITCEEDIPGTFFGKNLKINEDKNFQKALRFASGEQKKQLESYQKHAAPEPSGTGRPSEKLAELRSRLSQYKNCILATGKNTYALTSFGTVLAAGDNEEKQRDTAGWRNITAIAAGEYHVAGLKRDGTVISTGAARNFINRGQCETGKWSDITEIIAANFFTVGLKSNGSIVTCGDAIQNKNDLSSEYLTGVFKNIIGQAVLPKLVEFKRIFASVDDVFGLNKDGTVDAINTYSACKDWRGIIDVSSSRNTQHVVGLRSDQTVVAYGKNKYGECDVGHWTNIVAVAVGGGHYGAFTVGLRADGTVVAVGSNQHGQCRTSGWRDIVAIAAGVNHTVGLRADGTVIMAGDPNDDYSGTCETSDWKDIVAIAAGDRHTVGLKADGTVVAVGSNQYGQCDTQSWAEIGVEDPEKAALRALQAEAEKRRLALVSAKAEMEPRMVEIVKLRDKMQPNFGTYTMCLKCGKKHMFEVKTCKDCGAVWGRDTTGKGVAFRKYRMPNSAISCEIYQNGGFNWEEPDSTGRVKRRWLASTGNYFEYYINEKGEPAGETCGIESSTGYFYIFPETASGLNQTLRPNGVAEFYSKNS